MYIQSLLNGTFSRSLATRKNITTRRENQVQTRTHWGECGMYFAFIEYILVRRWSYEFPSYDGVTYIYSKFARSFYFWAKMWEKMKSKIKIYAKIVGACRVNFCKGILYHVDLNSLSKTNYFSGYEKSAFIVCKFHYLF